VTLTNSSTSLAPLEAARGRDSGRHLSYHGRQDALMLSTAEQRHAAAASTVAAAQCPTAAGLGQVVGAKRKECHQRKPKLGMIGMA
jgi:hypothetical protein